MILQSTRAAERKKIATVWLLKAKKQEGWNCRTGSELFTLELPLPANLQLGPSAQVYSKGWPQ